MNTTIDEQATSVDLLPTTPIITDAPAADHSPVYVAELTDDANAASFADLIHGQWRYVPQTQTWYERDGHVWRPDQQGRIIERARGIFRRLHRSRGQDPQEYSRHRRSALSRGGLHSTIGLSASDARITTHVDQLDCAPLHLSTPDGVIRLDTGDWITPSPEIMHTKTTSCAPDWNMKTPLLHRFLESTFGGDQELIRYVQIMLGYSTTGDVGHHLLPFLYGGGRNGKSQILDMASYVLDGYAGTAPAGFLIKQRHQSHPTEIMDLQGKRLVTASELNDGDELDEAKVKMLVGERRIKARAMRADFVEFTATHHIWMIGNHQPHIVGGGRSIWERIRLIPFVHTVPPEERIPDIGTKIATEEGPGVLAWLIDGARVALSGRIKTPESVQAATADYERDTDPLARFVEECCRLSTSDAACTPQGDLLAAYESWCEAEGEQRLGQNKLSRELKKRWNIDTTARNGRRFYIRVTLL